MPDLAVSLEDRAVARTVPGAIGIVPGHRAAHVCAFRVDRIELTVIIPPYGQLVIAIL